jgi:hypothetical protein
MGEKGVGQIRSSSPRPTRIADMFLIYMSRGCGVGWEEYFFMESGRRETCRRQAWTVAVEVLGVETNRF